LFILLVYVKNNILFAIMDHSALEDALLLIISAEHLQNTQMLSKFGPWVMKAIPNLVYYE
jgi:hypothetical protein